VDLLRGIRSRLAGILDTTPPEVLTAIPDGFSNNVLWNIGHAVVSQQRLHYGASGLPLLVTELQEAQFRKGSSPADWTSQPDIQLLRAQLAETAETLIEDYRGGRFREYREFTTATGPVLRSIEDAIVFNGFHEGYHTGVINALLRVA
jgi:hypothetical protein